MLLHEWEYNANEQPRRIVNKLGEVSFDKPEPVQEVLGVNETFTAGDFPITVLSATGSNGVFSGEGYVQVPYLADTKIKVTFDNIKINSERQLFDGKIVTTYDKTEKNVVKMDLKKQFEKVSEGIKALAQKKKEETEAIFGEQGEEFEKELQQWAVEEQKKQDEFNELEKQFAISQEINEQKNENIIPNKNENKEQISVKKQEKENNIASTGKLYLEHKGKKYYDGDILKLPFKRRMNEHFTLKSLQDSTKIHWKLYGRGGEKIIVKENFNIENKINGKLFDLSEKEAGHFSLVSIEAQAQIEDNPKVEVLVEKQIKPFKFNELKAIDNKNSKRIAKSGETLYYVHTPQEITEKFKTVSVDLDKKYNFDVPVLKEKRDARYTRFEMEVSPQIPIDEIPENYIEWNFNGTNLKHYELSLSKNVTYDKNIEVSARTGNPTADQYKKVKVQWVEEDRSKVSFNLGTPNVPDKMKSIFELTQWMEKITNGINKIPFFKKIKKNEKLENTLGFHFNIIPYETESFNAEDEKSRYYYREKKYIGGFEVGIAGSIKQPIWELPINKIPYVGTKLKEYIKAEVFVKADANMQGEIKGEIRYKKALHEKDFKEISSTFISELTMPVEFGVGAEAQILKKNDYLHFNATASGKTNANILKINWKNDKGIVVDFIPDGVNLDFRVDFSGSFLGKKLEVAPFYERFILIKKQQQNGK